MEAVPALRVRAGNDRPIQPGGAFVLYWMIAARRLGWNFALQHAASLARDLRRPLLVFEALRSGYRWNSARLHRFVIDGMRDHAAEATRRRIAYYPYVEPAPGAGKGLLEALGEHAAAVVTDEFPCFMMPRMVAAAATRLAVRLDVVDGNGLLPLRAADRDFPTAYAFRRFLQRTLPEHLEAPPAEDPLAGADAPGPASIPGPILARWPAASPALLEGRAGALEAIPIDHAVPPSALPGGPAAAAARLDAFLERRLARYDAERNVPDLDAASGLSPYLHFGHLSTHRILGALAAREGWTPGDLSGRADGKRAGWWGMSAPAEAFLDQLVTWRELGYNFCAHRADYDHFESLPAWAVRTLVEHAGDRREHVYGFEELERALTHDPLWNAAERQLVREGRLHNTLRMLWGKKILQWTRDPEQALEFMVELNNKYALDGRNPNSYSGIFWTLGRYDRPWGPERPVFGTIRYMSSENTARKVAVKEYLRKYAAAAGRPLTMSWPAEAEGPDEGA